MTPESRAEFNKVLLEFAENFNIGDFKSKTLHHKALTHLDKALASIEKIIIRERINELDWVTKERLSLFYSNRTSYKDNQTLAKKIKDRVKGLQAKLEGEK